MAADSVDGFGMIQTTGDMVAAISEPKAVVKPLRWVETRKAGEMRLRAAISRRGVVWAGVSFVASCRADLPLERVSLVLMTEWRGKPRAFARIDWRSGTPHANKSPACLGHRFLCAGRTHYHDPAMHEHIEIAQLFDGPEDLPVALPIAPEPQSFGELLETASSLMHIGNLEEIPEPTWAPRSSFV